MNNHEKPAGGLHLAMRTPSLADVNYAALAALFPNAVTETIDANGAVVRAIDKDVLAQEINAHVVEGREERYQFTWPDKKKSVLLANAPIAAALRPCREESVDFDTTENLYIEGDNLDVLKLLRETYLNRVKMIYIDPPYNNGGDYLYPDNFDDEETEFLLRDNQYDEQGYRLTQNTVNEGRFHTNWLNMLYPRLRIARDLMTDDGVIFISIDDNEVHNIRKLCDDIFGADNFINIVTVKTKIGGVSGSSEGKSLKDATEFVYIYAKNKTELFLNPVYITTPLSDRIKAYENEGKSWKYTSVMTKLDNKVLIKDDTTRGMKFYGYKTLETKSISAYARELGITEEDVYNQYADKIFRTTNAQSSVRQTVIKETRGHEYPMYGCEYAPIKGKNEGQVIEILYKGGSTSDQRNMMMFLSDVVEKVDGVYQYLDKVSSLWDDIEYNNLTKEGDTEFPNGKKPIKMLQRMLSLATDKNSLIIDFFSGSASTAHAVMQQNAEDDGNRKFIMVQIQEPIDNAECPNICEIGKERIRRAGAKIKADSPLTTADLDVGFRVLKLDSTNMKDVYYTPDKYTQKDFSFDGLADNIKEDRSPEDLLFQVMLDFGIPLSSRIRNAEFGKRNCKVL
jgi:adenine-specific DNA-methyltransferase